MRQKEHGETREQMEEAFRTSSQQAFIEPLLEVFVEDGTSKGNNLRQKKGIIMLGAHAQRSEVARLLTQISSEYEAACRGLFDIVQGTSQCDFIFTCMEMRANLHEQLHDLVGDAAVAMVADQLSANVWRGTE